MTKKKTRGTPKRAGKKPASATPTTALVRSLERRLDIATGQRATRVEVLPAVGPVADQERTIGEEVVSLGELGLVEIKLTEKEEAVLNEPVPENEVLLKPHKAFPPPYLSHPSYTRWFNRAFGRMGWSLVPASKPMKASGAIVCAYLLHIHGKPAALAWGEQEYFDNNKYQSYGDALEATVASALRRCAKHLGVGLELWDKQWAAMFHARHPDLTRAAIALARDDGGGYQARQAQAPPARNTASTAAPASQAKPAPDAAPPAAAHHKHHGEPVTEKQLRRLWVITKNSGRTDEELHRWLKRAYGLESSKLITRDIYDAICQAVEAERDLPEGKA